MEKIARQGLLYDFYGALLTEHQRQVYEDVVLYDLSLSEIAEEQGISRQGVHDLVKRCDRILEASFDGKIREYETACQRDSESGGRIFQNGRQESAPAHRGDIGRNHRPGGSLERVDQEDIRWLLRAYPINYRMYLKI